MNTGAWLGVGLGVFACLACLFVGRLLHAAKPRHHREHEDQAQREWVRGQALERIRSKQPDVLEVVDLTDPSGDDAVDLREPVGEQVREPAREVDEPPPPS